MIKQILDEMNLENGSNYKIDVLKKYKSNKTLQRVLKMTYDKVSHTYGVTMKNIPEVKTAGNQNLEWALDILDSRLVTRETTGNSAIDLIHSTLEELSEDDAFVFEKILNRDLRINIGRTNINKVFKNLIVKPIYMRCDIGRNDSKDENGKLIKGTYRNIDFKNGALIQKKADGTYREFTITDNKVDCITRSGESHNYPNFNKYMVTWPNRTFMGEITVWLDSILLEKILPKLLKSDAKNKTDDAKKLKQRFEDNPKGFILPRSISNGLVNSDDIPYDNLVLDLWDCITPKEYVIAGLKDKKNPTTIYYKDRFAELKSIIKDIPNINVIESHEIFSLKEALQITSKWMEDGFEGGVLKDKKMLFENRTSKKQLKLKLEIEVEMRITGFTPGKGKNINYFGAIAFENDEGTIKGKVGVSSMKETQRDWFWENKDEVIGKVIEVQFNDLSKASGNLHHSLSHPRFLELRNDKDETDTLQRAQELKEMAMELS